MGSWMPRKYIDRSEKNGCDEQMTRFQLQGSGFGCCLALPPSRRHMEARPSLRRRSPNMRASAASHPHAPRMARNSSLLGRIDDAAANRHHDQGWIMGVAHTNRLVRTPEAH